MMMCVCVRVCICGYVFVCVFVSEMMFPSIEVSNLRFNHLT